MGEILGQAKNIRALLSGEKYGVDYYQREYKWQMKHVAELIEDLADKFQDSYDPKDERSAIQSYGQYFLGSIIISRKNSHKFIVDGQQRLTTVTLLLICVHHLLGELDQKTQLADLIFSLRYGKRSFNLEVPERSGCMEALYSGQPFDDTGEPESVVNILARYQDIEERIPQELMGSALPYFADWLIENVYLVEITASTDEDAYTIFETMNDRGLSLTPADMLKGYLLANIGDVDRRTKASDVWKKNIRNLQDLGKDEDADGIKSWLRSQHAESIRERKRGATPQDFDLIGTEFHRWVRDHRELLGLDTPDDFAHFIEREFQFYAGQYHRLRQAAQNFTPELACVYYNAQNNFTLQYPVLLSSLRVDDPEREIVKKIRIVSTFIDILIARRIWNSRNIDYSTMQYAMFLIMREIRGKSPADVADILSIRLAAEAEIFASNDRFRLHGMNRRQMTQLLARITEYTETRSGMPSRYVEYVERKGKHGYEIEHIWSDHPEWHEDEFTHPTDFEEYRNRIGGLLLLPKSFNASYGDLPYADKLVHYLKQNLLAQSLHELAYERSPGFLNFMKESGLPFKPHPEFRKADLDARQELYCQIAEEVWRPERLQRELA
jgi:uncharacterized protein with ParB-like and HNH nuclease domain